MVGPGESAERAGQGWATRGGAGQGRASQGGEGRAGQGKPGQGRVGKGEGNTKDNAGQSALQEKAKRITVCTQGGGQGRANYKL